MSSPPPTCTLNPPCLLCFRRTHITTLPPAALTTDCPICYNPLTQPQQPDDTAVKLNRCGHAFHSSCLWDWFDTCAEPRKWCPYCRDECCVDLRHFLPGEGTGGGVLVERVQGDGEEGSWREDTGEGDEGMEGEDEAEFYMPDGTERYADDQSWDGDSDGE